MTPIVIFILLSFIFISILIYSFLKRYIKCPADKILVIYGKVSNAPNGKSAVWIHGGSAFVWPIIQDYNFLDLSIFEVEIDNTFIIKSDYEIKAKLNFKIGVTTEPEFVDNAVERLLGLEQTIIKGLANDLIIGQLRVYFVQMDIIKPATNREKMVNEIYETIENEFKKVGLRIINISILEISDLFGMLKSLDRKFRELSAQAKLNSGFQNEMDIPNMQSELELIDKELVDIEDKRLKLNERKLEIYLQMKDFNS